MAIVSLNKKAFEKIGKINFIEEKLTMLGCPVDAITDREILVDITPDRPDLLSEQGIKRALLSFIGKEKGLKEYNAAKSDYEVIIDKSVDEVRPFTACAIVKKLAFDNAKIKEIIDIQEKLHATFGRNRKKIAIGIEKGMQRQRKMIVKPNGIVVRALSKTIIENKEAYARKGKMQR